MNDCFLDIIFRYRATKATGFMPECLLVFIGHVESLKRSPAMYGYVTTLPVKHRSGPVSCQDLPRVGKSSFATRSANHFWMNQQSEMFV